MSKYNTLWEYLRERGENEFSLSFGEIKDVLGFEIDHSFLNAKKEAAQYGYEVGKISLKNSTVIFHKLS